jgi:hypothetical protein
MLGVLTCAPPKEVVVPKNKKKIVIPVVTIPRNATMRQIYAKLRREFSAADLQKFTEIGPTVSAEQLQEELEAIHRAETKKRRKK